MHLLCKCPAYADPRKDLIGKISELLMKRGHLLMAKLLKESAGSNGIDAAAILMGCTQATFNHRPVSSGLFEGIKGSRLLPRAY